MKHCFKCGTEKPRSEFYEHPRMADGLLGKCKECTKEDVRLNYRRRIDYYREYEQQRSLRKSRRETRKASQTRHRQRYPDRHGARTAVANALRDGRLERQPCEVCGDPATQAHHDDYSKPLKVRWLCFVHHRIEHGQEVSPQPRSTRGVIL